MADIVFPGQVSGGPLGREFLPSNFDLELYKGDYFPLTVTVRDSNNVPISLTGYTPRAQIRGVGSGEVFEFNAVLGGSTGVVNLTLTSPVSSTLTPGDGYIWDFQLTDPSGNVRTYIAGDVKVFDEVTRA